MSDDESSASGEEIEPESEKPTEEETSNGQEGATMVEALNQAFFEAMEEDDRALVLGEDVGVDGGIFRVTDGLLEKFGEDRVVDTPVAEAVIVGASVGLALGGKRPVPELQFSGFAYQAFHQVEQHVARYRKRTNGAKTVPMVVRMPYGAGVRALEHHSESREVYYTHTPGLRVVVPRSPSKARELLRRSINDPDPVIFLEPKALYRKFREELPEDGLADDADLSEVGTEVVREGEDVTLVAYGHMVHRALEVAEEVAREADVSCEVLDLASLAPLESDPIVESVARTGRLVVVHEGPRSFGVAAEVIARVNEDALLHLVAPPERITGYDVHPPLFGREEAYLPGGERIKAGIERVVGFA